MRRCVLPQYEGMRVLMLGCMPSGLSSFALETDPQAAGIALRLNGSRADLTAAVVLSWYWSHVLSEGPDADGGESGQSDSRARLQEILERLGNLLQGWSLTREAGELPAHFSLQCDSCSLYGLIEHAAY